MKKAIVLFALFGALSLASLFAVDNPLAKAKGGDWAKYLVTKTVEGNKFMSWKDAPIWWLGSTPGESGSMSLDTRRLFQKEKVNGGSDVLDAKGPFEPILGLLPTTKKTIVSEAQDTLVIKGKSLVCTKIVRKIECEGNVITQTWKGVSVIWISDSVPLGLVKMENDYTSAMKKGAKEDKIKESWIIDEYGFGNYKD